MVAAGVGGDRAGDVIGVDLGGTKIAAGIVDREGRVLERTERPTPVGSQDELVAALDAAVEELRTERVGALGFGVPSAVDQRSGVAVSSVNIPLAGLPLRDRMRERHGLPVAIENDATAAAVGEWRAGAGRGRRDLVMLTLGTGVGGGVIVDGRPLRGASGAAGELGHVVVEHDGRPCQGTCTGRGHLESYATGLAAGDAARAAFGPDATSRDLIERAQAGEPRAVEILAEIGRRLGSAIGSLVNVFDPEVVVLGGGFGLAAADFLDGPAREVLRREALPPGQGTPIVRAELGAEAGLVGAAFVAFEALDGD